MTDTATKPGRTPTLLPCPFDGEEARLIHHALFYRVQCVRCGTSFGEMSSKSEVIARWNRRAQPAPQACEPDFEGIASQIVFGWKQLNPNKMPLRDFVKEALTQMYRLGQQATRSAPLPEDVAEYAQHLRRTAVHFSCAPGKCQYPEDLLGANADLIERLAQDLAKADAVIAGFACWEDADGNQQSISPAAEDEAVARHAARQAKPKENADGRN
jgi:hypothetical protein